jgi:hypothetical protein
MIFTMAACKALELTHPAVNKSLRKLEEMGIVPEIMGCSATARISMGPAWRS